MSIRSIVNLIGHPTSFSFNVDIASAKGKIPEYVPRFPDIDDIASIVAANVNRSAIFELILLSRRRTLNSNRRFLIADF
jgi:hypothetical protein